MWSCRYCYHIYHFTCARDWADRKEQCEDVPRLSDGGWNWPCPTCKNYHVGGDKMQPTCWCGSYPYHNDEKVIGGSCGEICVANNKCESTGITCVRFCQKLCHPGPCEPVQCERSGVLNHYSMIRAAESRWPKSKIPNSFHTPLGPHAPRPPPPVARRVYPEDFRAGMNRDRARMLRPALDRTATDPSEELPDDICSVLTFLILLGLVEMGLGFWIEHHTE